MAGTVESNARLIEQRIHKNYCAKQRLQFLSSKIISSFQPQHVHHLKGTCMLENSVMFYIVRFLMFPNYQTLVIN